MSACETVLNALRDHGCHVNVNGHTARARCPAHNGNSSTSLAITPIDGSVLLHCHGGCSTNDVLAAIGLGIADLYDTRSGARYDYPDGRRVHRTPNKNFYQKGNTKGQDLYHADRTGDATTVYIPEGEKDVHAIEAVGGVAVCSAMGAGKAHKFDWSPLRGKHAIIVADKDKPGRDHAAQVAELLDSIAKSVVIKQAAVGKDAADHIAAGHTLDELVDFTRQDRQPKPEPVQPVSLAKLHTRFKFWLGKHYDLDAIDATLAAAAAERLDGDPVWLLIISGPGATKTETIITLKDCDEKTFIVSTISSVGALLSATAKKERAKDATGGLLKELEPRGMMIIKDLTSILSLPISLRQPILSALREVYDGHYVRDCGVDGGRKIPWTGRIAIIGAVTTAWDDAHAAIAEMGDRFVLLRVDSTTNRRSRGEHAVDNTGAETTMRDELNKLARGVIASVNPQSAPTPTPEEKSAIVNAADVVTLARTAVKYDYRGDVIDNQAPELPTRFAKQLTQIFRGAVTIGLSRQAALRLAIRCARDSIPPLRLAIIDDLSTNPHSTPTDVRRRLGKPRATVDRQLQALHILRIAALDECETTDQFGKRQSSWHYSLAPDIDPSTLDPDLVTRKVTTYGLGPKEEDLEREEETPSHTPSDISGNGATSADSQQSDAANAAYRNGLCRDCGVKPCSAGRPRCAECHAIHVRVMAGYDQ